MELFLMIKILYACRPIADGAIVADFRILFLFETGTFLSRNDLTERLFLTTL
tara:strand:- start:225 stop:380 length:156 start_codon:yes stop_codon:yes gene_type:complete